jgi:hypothetical protein
MKLLILAAVIGLTSNMSAESRGVIQFAFASVDEGRQVLMNRDDFVQRLSPFERAARLKTTSQLMKPNFSSM